MPPVVVAVRLSSVPSWALKESVSPSATGLLLASTTVTFMVLVLVPSAVRFAGVAVTVTVAGAPATKLTVPVAFTPPHVAVMVAEPRLVGLVRVTVATPLVVVALAAEKVPAVVVKFTVVPSAMLLPLASFTVAVIRVPEAPSAAISEHPVLTVTVPTVAATRVILTVEDVPLEEVAVIVSLPPPGTASGAV